MSRRVLIFAAVGLAAVVAAVAAFLLLRDGGSEEAAPPVRACDVLTEETASGLLGTVKRGTDSAEGAVTRCQYLSEETGGSVDLAAQRYAPSGDTTAVQQAQQEIGRLHEGRSTAYPDLGDEAYLLSVQGPADPSGDAPGEVATTLSARAGDLRVTVFLNGGTDPEQSRAAAEKLIRDYLARAGGE